MGDNQVPSTDEAFQEQFRGSRQEICRRLSVYLPLLEEAGVRELDGEILDIGFGRGEWLGLLADHGYRASGVDADPGVVAAGEEAGFSVSAGDALEAVAACPDHSLAAVTAFHVVEHLEPRRLADFVHQIHRCLVPGGLVVLETPNPENVSVGAGSFYIDPDHERPVPPQLLDFYAREAGFAVPRIARLNRALLGAPLAEVPPDVPGALQVNAAVYALNGVLFAAPDYALVAQKDGGQGSVLDAATYERVFGPQPLDLQSYRVLAAEDAAARHRAEALAAEERAAQQQYEVELATARATVAETRVCAADERAESAESRTLEVAAELQRVRQDFFTVATSLSWRVTAPLRAAAATARVTAGGRGPGAPGPKRYAKLAVGHPVRWALARPRLGPAIDKGLTRVPAVDRKVRIAVYETTVTARREVIAGGAGDLAELPESARPIAEDLLRVVSGGGD